MSDLGAGETPRLSQRMQRLIADEVADIGDGPVGAGLDELVVVELGEILLHRRELAGKDRQQGLQRSAGGLLPQRIDAFLLGDRRAGQGLEALELQLLRRRQQIAHARGELGIADPMDRRQQAEQRVGVDAHGMESTTRGAASRVNSSAAKGSCVRDATGRAAKRRGTKTGLGASLRWSWVTFTASTPATS